MSCLQASDAAKQAMCVSATEIQGRTRQERTSGRKNKTHGVRRQRNKHSSQESEKWQLSRHANALQDTEVESINEQVKREEEDQSSKARMR
jgi:hypothetical protein